MEELEPGGEKTTPNILVVGLCFHGPCKLVMICIANDMSFQVLKTERKGGN